MDLDARDLWAFRLAMLAPPVPSPVIPSVPSVIPSVPPVIPSVARDLGGRVALRPSPQVPRYARDDGGNARDDGGNARYDGGNARYDGARARSDVRGGGGGARYLGHEEGPHDGRQLGRGPAPP